MAREGHIQALAAMDQHGPRQAMLETFAWSIADGPSEGAVLPDCVALAQDPDGLTALMFAGQDAELVIMPISTEKLLVGRRTADVAFDVADYNRAAVEASQDFFLAGRDGADFRQLAAGVGKDSKNLLGKTLDEVFAELQPSDSVVSDAGGEPDPIDMSTWRPGQPQDIRFTLACRDCATEERAAQINIALRSLIEGLARVLPLGRLDTILFALDYAAAVREVDRGHPGWKPVETVNEDIGIGIARTIAVSRDGRMKAYVVLRAYVADMLLSDVSTEVDWALHTLVTQFARVAWIVPVLFDAAALMTEGGEEKGSGSGGDY